MTTEGRSRTGDYCECCDPDVTWCANKTGPASTTAESDRTPVEAAARALREANRYPELSEVVNGWAATCKEITERDAEAVVAGLRAAGYLLVRAEDVPVANSYSREEFGESEAWGWNACRDHLTEMATDDASEAKPYYCLCPADDPRPCAIHGLPADASSQTDGA